MYPISTRQLECRKNQMEFVVMDLGEIFRHFVNLVNQDRSDRARKRNKAKMLEMSVKATKILATSGLKPTETAALRREKLRLEGVQSSMLAIHQRRRALPGAQIKLLENATGTLQSIYTLYRLQAEAERVAEKINNGVDRYLKIGSRSH